MSDNKPKNKGLEYSKAFVLADLLDYAPDSIVSRIIAKNDAGNITLFSFDKGQELSEHTAPYDAVVQVLDGEVRLTIGGQDVKTAAGEVVIMPANVPHAVYADRRFKMLLTMLKEAAK
jgi:quercetin dioxygenase-like cupin family protein